jgi:proton-coupled amino acid transporter
MSDPLPVNAKERSKNSDSSHMSEHVIAGSFDRAESTARLGTSPLNSHMQLGTSPAKSIQSHQSYGSHYLKPTDNEPSRPRSPHRDNLSADMSDRKVAKAVKRHLVSHSPSASSNHVQLSSSPSQNGRSQSGPNNSSGDSSDSEVASVHHLHGGAITHDIYKWTESVEQDRKDRMKRSQSVAVLRKEPTDPALTNLKDPGGFRRFFIINRATKSGKAPPSLITRSFVDFLALYGHYAGEYLRDEEDSDDEEEFQRYRWSRRYDEEGGTSDERTALLRQCQAKKTEGTATPSKVVFLLLKSFIGTGVMFLPKA